MGTKKSSETISDIVSVQLEEEANIFSLKCLGFAQIIHGVIWILNLLDIFIVDSTLMNRSFFSSVMIMLIVSILCFFVGMKRPVTKYIIMIALVMDVTVININLTYHTVLLYVLPLLYSIQYSNRRFQYCSFGLSVLSIYVSAMVGFFWGLCDANMAVLTTETMGYYYNKISGVLEFKAINDNPWITLPLFYVLPRSMILFVLIPATRHISDGIAKRAVSEQNFRRLSETDEMTQLYNRNKYIKMIKEYYPTVQNVGVIFWDVNELKIVNDTMGHEYGDYLIMSVADAIRETADEMKKAYRIGGDEFIMVVEDATEEKMAAVLKKWKKKMEKKNNVSKILLSASVGFALGSGAEIGDVISRADANMYLQKQKYHMK